MKILKLSIIFFIMACTNALINASEEKVRVSASILPLKYFVEKIGKGRVSVSVIVPPGADPHSFEMKPGVLKRLSESSLLVIVGTPLEFEQALVKKILEINKSLVLCDSSKGIELIGSSSNGPGADPHIWTSLRNEVVMASNIKNALVKMDPKNTEFYEKNYLVLVGELEMIDFRIKRVLAVHNGGSFLVFHSAWKYFARDYSLNEISIESGGREPSARDIAAVIKKARDAKIKTVFVSPHRSEKSARSIAKEIGGRLVTVDDLSENIPLETEKLAGYVRESYGK